MQEMHLYDNVLTGTIPSQFGNMKALRVLELEDNDFGTSVVSPEICANQEDGLLETLEMDCNTKEEPETNLIDCTCCSCCGSACADRKGHPSLGGSLTGAGVHYRRLRSRSLSDAHLRALRDFNTRVRKVPLHG
jgi:hypothetical protein